MRVLLALLFFCGFLTSALAQEALRPGDTVTISVWQDPKLDRKVVIGPDGYIGFPLVGQIRVGGLTPRAVEDLLKSHLQKNYTGQLDVSVALADVNKETEDETKPKVYVTGEVLRPGPYFTKPQINVMQAIALAGGLVPLQQVSGSSFTARSTASIQLLSLITTRTRQAQTLPTISILNQAISSLFLNEACLNEMGGNTATAPDRTVVL